MKSLKNFELSYRVVLSEMTALANDNAKLALALEAERRKHQQAMHTAAAEQRALREQVVTATRSKKRAERKHDASLTKARERAAYYRSKLAEYRRELLSVKSIVRNQKHD
jgi:hypothetical protein